MQAISSLFDSTTLLVPVSSNVATAGGARLEGTDLVVVPLGEPIGDGILRKAGLIPWTLKHAVTLLREIGRADAVHVPIPSDVGTIAMLLAFFMRKRLFVRHCGNWTDPRTKAEHFWRWFMERTAGGRNVMLATGGAPTPPSRKNPAMRWIFSSSLWAEDFPESRERSVPNECPVLLIACRQEQRKGTGRVIEALPLIARRFPGVELRVVGDGPDLVLFRQSARGLGLDGKVTFTGKLGHAEVLKEMYAADLFVYPTSASEGFPKVVLEALANGLPVVTTDVSVLGELIPGSGVILRDLAPEAVADAVIGCLESDSNYEEMSARAVTVARAYSLERWRDTIGDLLRTSWCVSLRGS